MHHDWAIERTLGDVQRLLQANLPPKSSLPDDRTVTCLRAVVQQEDVRRAIKEGPDTALAFVLRGINRILSDRRQVDRATIAQLWEFMDEPALDDLVSVKRGRGVVLLRKKPRAR
jgi:hypothetical protein